MTNLSSSPKSTQPETASCADAVPHTGHIVKRLAAKGSEDGAAGRSAKAECRPSMSTMRTQLSEGWPWAQSVAPSKRRPICRPEAGTSGNGHKSPKVSCHSVVN